MEAVRVTLASVECVLIAFVRINESEVIAAVSLAHLGLALSTPVPDPVAG